MERKYLTADEFIKHLPFEITKDKFLRAVTIKRLPHYKVGNKRFFSIEDLPVYEDKLIKRCGVR